MGATQRELADRLNVSQVTVSRALRDDKGVSPALRKRILAEASRRGYSIDASNYAARQMRQRALGGVQKTNVICAIVFDEDDSSGFGGRILRGMNREGTEKGLEVVMMTHFRGDLPLIVSRGQVDGMIRLLGDLDLAKGNTTAPVPWVSVFYDVPDVDLVTVDNFGGARQVGRFLCARGHRRIAYIGPATDIAHERLAGLRAAAAEGGAAVPDELVRMERFAADEQPTRELVAGLVPLLERGDFTALVGYNDFMADVALIELREHGLDIPRDVSIAGFDGVAPSRMQEQMSLATAAIPLEEVGAAAVRLLQWRLESPDAPRRRIVLETEFREGATVAAI
jgi:LacI family transcriptional regulator